MRNGHYTASNIDGLTITPADKKKHRVQTAYGRVDGVLIFSNGFDIEIGEREDKIIFSGLFDKFEEKIPKKYQIVAEIIRKKANGRGGKRIGAGRPKTLSAFEEKQTRSFRLTDYEYAKVKEYISELRKEVTEIKGEKEKYMLYGYEVTSLSSFDGLPYKSKLPSPLKERFKTKKQWEELGYWIKDDAQGTKMHPTPPQKMVVTYYLKGDEVVKAWSVPRIF